MLVLSLHEVILIPRPTFACLPLLQFTTCSVLLSLISLQWMHFATNITPNQDIAFATAVFFTLINILFSGFLAASPVSVNQKMSIYLIKLRQSKGHFI